MAKIELLLLRAYSAAGARPFRDLVDGYRIARLQPAPLHAQLQDAAQASQVAIRGDGTVLSDLDAVSGIAVNRLDRDRVERRVRERRERQQPAKPALVEAVRPQRLVGL